MTPEAQRVAIAETMGFDVKMCPIHRSRHCCSRETPPNYLCDLNAMHEVEKAWIIGELEPIWIAELSIAVHGRSPRKHTSNEMVRATAAQRAEAFLRTIGKWVES